MAASVPSPSLLRPTSVPPPFLLPPPVGGGTEEGRRRDGGGTEEGRRKDGGATEVGRGNHGGRLGSALPGGRLPRGRSGRGCRRQSLPWALAERGIAWQTRRRHGLGRVCYMEGASAHPAPGALAPGAAPGRLRFRPGAIAETRHTSLSGGDQKNFHFIVDGGGRRYIIRV